ncbi:AEC family transporter [uncultured Clostridium sp.]|uniref:AEC family transporter n=1 Tax=uncultured Clostridium sp. TaxID=59620 RepID=UPI0025DC24E1|nr:AEC family transporter [uncultured Clostridium sp.]
MNVLNVVVNQIGMMYIIILTGFILYKKGIINDKGTLQLTNILLWIVNPMLMVTRYQMEFSKEKFIELVISLGLSFIIIALSIMVAKIFNKKGNGIDQFATAFSNSGFMGIPLVSSILGVDSIFSLSAYIVCFNLLSYTYGIYLVSNDKSQVSLKKIIFNPAVIAVGIGMIIFISPVKLPAMVYNAFDSLGNINTPLAMLILGTYIAQSKISELFTNKHIYYISFLKLIVVPIFAALLLKFVPNSLYNIKMVMYIASITPTGMTVAMLSQVYGADYSYGAKIVGLTTLLSLITIPIVMILPGLLW